MFEEIESEVLFGASGNSLAALKSGWSSPEPEFCWAIGLESLVVLPHPPAARMTCLVQMRNLPISFRETMAPTH